MKATIKKILNKISKEYTISFYCEECLTSKWIYVIIYCYTSNLYFAGFNSEREFNINDLRDFSDYDKAIHYVAQGIYA